jgi:alkylation response protein AidB-like acyl-CoA dehydrogenase
MNFDLSDEQKMLAEQVQGLLAERAPFDHLRTLIDGDAEWDKSLWAELGAMGFLGAAIPEEYGGLGMAALEQGVIAQEFGRTNAAVSFFPPSSCVPTPFVWQAATRKRRYGCQSLPRARLWALSLVPKEQDQVSQLAQR